MQKKGRKMEMRNMNYFDFSTKKNVLEGEWNEQFMKDGLMRTLYNQISVCLCVPTEGFYYAKRHRDSWSE